MYYPTVVWNQLSAISFQDMSGSPTVVIGSDQSVYFAAAVKGSNSFASSTLSNTFDICIGKISSAGVVQWIRLFATMNTLHDEYQPSMVIGANDELYVAYVTTGAVPNQINMNSLPPLFRVVCAPTDESDEDVVVARINTSPTPTVQWIYQSPFLNTFNGETQPVLAIDRVSRLLYVAYQSNTFIGCNASTEPVLSVGLVCFNLNGTFYWKEGQFMNDTVFANTNPSIAADQSGNVYLALETYVRSKANQVEVCAFHTTLNNSGAFVSYNTLWRASDFVDLTSNSVCKCPSIACDNKGNIYLAFLTNGSVLNYAHTSSTFDMVVVCLTSSKSLFWIQPGATFTNISYAYTDCDAPSIHIDNNGNLFLTLVTTLVAGSSVQYNGLGFKLNPRNGAIAWTYRDSETYTAYACVRTGAPNTIFDSMDSQLERIAVYGRDGAVVFGWNDNRSSGKQISILYVKQELYYRYMDGVEYILNVTDGCKSRHQGN